MLATELALSMEHYQDDPSQWFPESLALIDDAAEFLTKFGRELPEPILMVLKRRIDRE